MSTRACTVARLARASARATRATRRAARLAASSRVVRPTRALDAENGDADDGSIAGALPDAADVNLDGLKKETQRRIERQVKKVGKTTTKLRVARETVDALLANADADAAALEACPDVDSIASELEALKMDLDALNALNDVLRGCKSVNSSSFIEDAYPRAAALALRDAPPTRPARVKKVKGPRSDKPRMPYWTFVSIDGIDIRVGRTSSDNDSVSCDPECRDSRDWWMHAAGCPGSHVVIRYTGEDVPKETIIDAAVLAAANSKANQVGKAPVSLVRCRQVSKPRGAKPGLVQLSGDIRTVTVNVKDEAARLERLMATKS